MKSSSISLAFQEHVSGFTPSKAAFEASRCVECYDAPCVKACPLHVDVPTFISKLKVKDYTGANQTILERCILPGTCARTCPAEKLCVKNCCVADLVGPVAINELQRFAADRGSPAEWRQASREEADGTKVAVIGSGPAGLSCAAELVKKGYGVVIFESEKNPGGSMAHSIPSYRLPRDIVQREIDYITRMGVKIQTNSPIGDARKLIKDGYRAVFLGIGLEEPVFIDVPGRDLTGVLSGLRFLREISSSVMQNRSPTSFAKKNVAVIGGGDLAMDTAISAAKVAAKRVHLIYRRSFKEMPAAPSSLHLAKELGVMFWILANPTRIMGNNQGNVCKIECVETRIEPSHKSDRGKPVPIEGTEFQIDVDYVIAAIGQRPSKNLMQRLGINTSSEETIIVNEAGETSQRGVFAGGDICSGGGTVVQAIADGINAANGIQAYLTAR